MLSGARCPCPHFTPYTPKLLLHFVETLPHLEPPLTSSSPSGDLIPMSRPAAGIIRAGGQQSFVQGDELDSCGVTMRAFVLLLQRHALVSSVPLPLHCTPVGGLIGAGRGTMAQI
ncbi:hypothetical protein JZ751_017413 [Albula glossodonta]|uniref:Uncharacterized protein n=1 Tax=Albula glossodonta TaxID=121402 RepID=A0A8T2PP04_9TELE|nr:hypothetical protein JZ751_017413 [Albula glossodonta]